MVRKIMFVLSGLTLILIVVACRTVNTLSAEVTPDWPTLPTNSVDGPSSESLAGWQTEFIAGYERELGPINSEQVHVLLTNAVVLCAYMDIEHTIPEAFDLGVDQLHMSSDQAAVVIEAAVRTHCPQYEGELQREVT